MPQQEIEAACKYEYMRESQLLRDKLTATPRDGKTLPRIVLPSFAKDFTVRERFLLIRALQDAGFPKPWNKLSDDSQKELVAVMRGKHELNEKLHPPLVIEAVELVRDFEAECDQDQSMDQEYVWRVDPASPAVSKGHEHSTRDHFFAVIRIDEAYKQGEIVAAFKAWLAMHKAESKHGNEGFPGKLNQLAVMRIRHHSPRGKRESLMADATGKTSYKVKNALSDLTAQKLAGLSSAESDSEASRDSAKAREYFRELFPEYCHDGKWYSEDPISLPLFRRS